MNRVIYTGTGSNFITVKQKPKALTPTEIAYNKWRQQRDHDESVWPGIAIARDLETIVVKAIFDGCQKAMCAHPRVSLEAARQVLRERRPEERFDAD